MDDLYRQIMFGVGSMCMWGHVDADSNHARQDYIVAHSAQVSRRKPGEFMDSNLY